jgi:sugar transferase (PEP-CTERM system associated)
MFRVFRHHGSAATLLDALMDAVIGFIAVVVAAFTIGLLPKGSLVAPLASPMVLLAAAGFAVTMALLHSFVGLYRHTGLSVGSIAVRMAFALVVGGYVSYLVLRPFNEDGRSGYLFAYAAVYLLVGSLLTRFVVSVLHRAAGVRRVLIIGTGDEANGVAKDIAQSRVSNEVVGFYPTSFDAPIAVDGSKVLNRDERLDELVKQHRVSEIIVAAREQRGGVMPMEQLLLCRTQGVPILDLSAYYERSKAEVPIDSLKASWLVYGSGFVQGTARRVAKRVFDIVSSFTLLVLASPVMLLTAIAIRLDSRGPVLYRQERVGEAGRNFMCIKFRSMRTDAEKDGVARWATKNDSRVTRVGAFIRKTRIDELPQLISVLRGEMSMVGPRPERPSFVSQLRDQIPYYDLRHSIKPGLTGWAQVRYSYGASLEDARRKHQFDLYYVKNNSLLLDLLVLVETVTVVLFREGAQ